MFKTEIKSLLRIISLLILPAFFIFPASARQDQDKPVKKDDPFGTIRVDTDLVSIDVRVLDQSANRSAVNLTARDFVVFEDGVRQKISNFSTIDVPLNLVLLIDTSGSTRSELGLIQRAARRFLDEMRPQDRIAVIQFNKQVELIKDLTSDRAQVERALVRLTGGSGTAYYDSLQLSIDEILKNVSGRKAIIALTDGVDSFGFNTYEQILPLIEKAGATIYVLELDTEVYTAAGMMRECSDPRHFRFSGKQLEKYLREYAGGGSEENYTDHCALSGVEKMQINRRLYQSARRELREMTAKTGGRVYPVKDLSRLDPAYSQIASELHTVYSLGYYPSNEKHDGRWRNIRIEVRKRGLTVQTRPGYRAPID